jgi:hypothetical protein
MDVWVDPCERVQAYYKGEGHSFPLVLKNQLDSWISSISAKLRGPLGGEVKLEEWLR